MLKNNVLFVIGAGASVEIGFPLGDAFANQIRDSLGQGQSGQIGYPELGRLITNSLGNNDQRTHSKIRDAYRTISRSLNVPGTIDECVNKFGDQEIVKNVAKHAIAFQILKAEANSDLKYRANERIFLDKKPRDSDGKIKESFYPLLASQLTGGAKRHNLEVLSDKLNVISFNYDRSLECYLAAAISDSFDIDTENAFDVVNKMNIVHPYGTLGSLPRHLAPNIQDQNIVSYGFNNIDNLHLGSLASNIFTFGEGLNDPELIKSIQDMVNAAKIIVFLGFGFHQQNMKLLGIGGNKQSKTVISTGGEPEPMHEELKRIIANTLYEPGLNSSLSSSTIMPPGVYCRKLFTDYWRMWAT
jgi:hypothetical protein